MRLCKFLEYSIDNNRIFSNKKQFSTNFHLFIVRCTEIEDNSKHIAVIACSSGSTGLPKSICMTHALFLNTFFHRNDEMAFTNLCFSSLYWFSGVWAAISIVFKNTRVFTMKPFSTDLFFDLVEKYKASCNMIYLF